MNKEEITKWIIDKFKDCYPVITEDNNDMFFWVYDEKYIRKLKLCKLNNQEITSHNKIKGTVLFNQIITTGSLYFHYETFWNFIENNYSNCYDEIQSLVINILKEHTNLKFSRIYYSQFNAYDLNTFKLYNPSINNSLIK